MVPFACPGCDAAFGVESDRLGTSAKCPKCRLRFLIPDLAPPAVPVPVAPPSAPQSARSESGAAVEVAPCPGCRRAMTVAAEDVGHRVECLFCGTSTHAALPGTVPAVRVEPRPPAPRRPGGATPAPPNSYANPFDDRWGDTTGDAPGDPGDPYTRPGKPKRELEPDRGGVILALAIMGWATCGLFGIPAYFMANTDLAKMDSRRMTRSGRGNTQAAKLLVIIQFWLGVSATFLALAVKLLGLILGVRP